MDSNNKNVYAFYLPGSISETSNNNNNSVIRIEMNGKGEVVKKLSIEQVTDKMLKYQGILQLNPLPEKMILDYLKKLQRLELNANQLKSANLTESIGKFLTCDGDVASLAKELYDKWTQLIKAEETTNCLTNGESERNSEDANAASSHNTDDTTVGSATNVRDVCVDKSTSTTDLTVKGEEMEDCNCKRKRKNSPRKNRILKQESSESNSPNTSTKQEQTEEEFNHDASESKDTTIGTQVDQNLRLKQEKDDDNLTKSTKETHKMSKKSNKSSLVKPKQTEEDDYRVPGFSGSINKIRANQNLITIKHGKQVLRRRSPIIKDSNEARKIKMPNKCNVDNQKIANENQKRQKETIPTRTDPEQSKIAKILADNLEVDATSGLAFGDIMLSLSNSSKKTSKKRKISVASVEMYHKTKKISETTTVSTNDTSDLNSANKTSELNSNSGSIKENECLLTQNGTGDTAIADQNLFLDLDVPCDEEMSHLAHNISSNLLVSIGRGMTNKFSLPWVEVSKPSSTSSGNLAFMNENDPGSSRGTIGAEIFYYMDSGQRKRIAHKPQSDYAGELATELESKKLRLQNRLTGKNKRGRRKKCNTRDTEQVASSSSAAMCQNKIAGKIPPRNKRVRHSDGEKELNSGGSYRAKRHEPEKNSAGSKNSRRSFGSPLDASVGNCGTSSNVEASSQPASKRKKENSSDNPTPSTSSTAATNPGVSNAEERPRKRQSKKRRKKEQVAILMKEVLKSAQKYSHKNKTTKSHAHRKSGK